MELEIRHCSAILTTSFLHRVGLLPASECRLSRTRPCVGIENVKVPLWTYCIALSVYISDQKKLCDLKVACVKLRFIIFTFIFLHRIVISIVYDVIFYSVLSLFVSLLSTVRRCRCFYI